MALYIQHGAHKANKIDEAFNLNLADGVILSPKNEKKPENIVTTCEQIKSDFPEKKVLVDPQFHYSAFETDYEGHLSNYVFFQSELKRKDFLNPSRIQKYVEDVIDYQSSLSVSGLLSPTVLIRNFNDLYSHIALQLIAATEDYVSKVNTSLPLFHSLVVSQDAFSSIADIDDMLNTLTTFDASGFYITIDRTTKDYTQRFDSETLSKIMYFIYKLGVVNKFEIIIGYCDLVGLLFHAVGAESSACGWYGSQRQFSTLRFAPSSGGNQPRPRYTSAPLLNSILVFPEFDSACNIGFADRVASITDFDTELIKNRSTDDWDIKTSSLHHWQTLSSMFRYLDATDSTEEKLSRVQALIEKAVENYTVLQDNGVQFEANSNSKHLTDWLNSIEEFSRLTKIR